VYDVRYNINMKASGRGKRFFLCQVERRVLVQKSTLHVETGETTVLWQAWSLRPCGIPLFQDQDRQTGVCQSCRDGWTHPHSYPTGMGLALLAKVRGEPVAEPWLPGTVIPLFGEEHRVVRYQNGSSFVVLLRALGWEITLARESIAKNMTNEARVKFKDDGETVKVPV
jgi:hypothetical protein